MLDVKTSPKFEWADQWILASTRKLERLITFLNSWLLQSSSKVSGSRRLLLFTFFLFFRHAWQVTSHSKSPRTPGNEAGSTDQLKIYAWSNFLPRSHVDGAELRLGRRSCVVFVRGATKTYSLFRNIALKRAEKRCSASRCKLGSCKLRGYWLLIG